METTSNNWECIPLQDNFARLDFDSDMDCVLDTIGVDPISTMVPVMALNYSYLNYMDYMVAVVSVASIDRRHSLFDLAGMFDRSVLIADLLAQDHGERMAHCNSAPAIGYS